MVHSLLEAGTAFVGFDDKKESLENYFLCDGAADDVQINLAEAYVTALGGGSIVFERGTYAIVDPIIPTGDDIWYKGQGSDTFLDGDGLATTEHIFHITGRTQIQITDMSMQTNDGGGLICHCIFIEDGANRFLIENVIFVDSDDNGIHIEGTNIVGGKILNCKILDTDGNGIFVDMDGGNLLTNLIIRGCDILGSGGEGIELNDVEDSEVTGNIIDTTGADGLFLQATADNNIVSDNIIRNWTGEPIDDDGNENTVRDNDCGGDVFNSKGCGFATVQESITHLAGSGWVEVPGRTFAEAVTIANAGVVLRGASWASTINGGTTGHAVEIAAAECMVRDIEVRTTQAGTNNFDGVHVTNAGSGARIINVQVGASDRYGIYIDDDLCIVEKCFITNIDEAGIYLDDEADTTIIVDNHLHQILTDGISVNSADSVIIGNNYINDCGSDGIQLATSDNCNIEGNTILASTAYDINISNAACDGTRVGTNILTGAGTACIDDVGTGTMLPTKPFPFIAGGDVEGTAIWASFVSATASAKGWSVAGADDWAVALGQLPQELQQIVRFKIWAVALGAPIGGGGQMHLEIIMNAGADDLAFTTEPVALANFDGETTDYVATDVVHWVVDSGDDADIGSMVGGMSIEFKVIYEVGADPDGATNAVFRTVEVEYV